MFYAVPLCLWGIFVIPRFQFFVIVTPGRCVLRAVHLDACSTFLVLLEAFGCSIINAGLTANDLLDLVVDIRPILEDRERDVLLDTVRNEIYAISAAASGVFE